MDGWAEPGISSRLEEEEEEEEGRIAVQRIIDDALALPEVTREVRVGPGGRLPLDLPGPPLRDGGQVADGEFAVVVHTGDAWGQGTSAGVVVAVAGALGSLGLTELAPTPDEWQTFGQPVLDKLRPLSLAELNQPALGRSGRQEEQRSQEQQQQPPPQPGECAPEPLPPPPTLSRMQRATSLGPQAVAPLWPGVQCRILPAACPAADSPQFCLSGRALQVAFRRIPDHLGDLRLFVKKKGGRGVLDKIFEQLDADGSGALQPEEVRVALRAVLEQSLRVAVSQQDLRVLLALLFPPGSEERLSQEQFEHAGKSARQLVAAVNALHAAGNDAGGDKYVAELRGALAELAGRQVEAEAALRQRAAGTGGSLVSPPSSLPRCAVQRFPPAPRPAPLGKLRFSVILPFPPASPSTQRPPHADHVPVMPHHCHCATPLPLCALMRDHYHHAVPFPSMPRCSHCRRHNPLVRSHSNDVPPCFYLVIMPNDVLPLSAYSINANMVHPDASPCCAIAVQYAHTPSLPWSLSPPLLLSCPIMLICTLSLSTRLIKSSRARLLHHCYCAALFILTTPFPFSWAPSASALNSPSPGWLCLALEALRRPATLLLTDVLLRHPVAALP